MAIALTIASPAQSKKPLHPYNQRLEQLYPRGFQMPFPEIPRLSALQALHLYINQKAFLVHVGDSGPNVIGALQLTENQAAKLDLDKLLKAAAGRTIIAYCY